MKHVNDLTKKELDYWVGRSLGWSLLKQVGTLKPLWTNSDGLIVSSYNDFRPSMEWSRTGPLIKKFKIGVISAGKEKESFIANFDGLDFWVGAEMDSPQMAICRAVIFSMFGENLEDIDL